jgi:tripartite ATP-independent transporter DctM subunit
MLLTLFVIMLLLFAAGVPVAFTMGVVTLYYFFVDPGLPMVMIPLRFVAGADSYALMAIPLFMLAGNIMNGTGITERIFNFTNSLVGHFRGGMAYVNVLASFIFSGMSGSELADASGLGTVEIKAMVDTGYDKEFSASITAASATIGPIFPPSIPMVIIGGVAGISIGKLFVGGVIPGVLLALFMMLFIYFIARKRNYPKLPKVPLRTIGRQFISALPALGAPVVVLGGIVAGFFTPTEAGVVAVLYALFIGFFVYRETRISELTGIMLKTAKETAKIMFIVSGAFALAWVLAREQTGIVLTEGITAISTDPNMVLTLIVFAFLFTGCFINPSANIIIFVPMVMPLVNSVGLDPVHFGVVTTLALMIGLVTPPMGLCMFIICEIADISIMQFTRGMVPFFIALLVVLIVIMFVPQTITWLPSVIFGG